MIHESYLANWRNLPSREVAEWIAVTRTAQSVLAPGWGLLHDWKEGLIDWAEYTRRFRAEICGNPAAIARLREIRELAEHREVYLLCYEKALDRRCHRFLLLDLIKEVTRNEVAGTKKLIDRDNRKKAFVR